MATATPDMGLSTQVEPTGTEMSVSQQQAMAMKEIEAAILVANRFPRDEDRAFGMVMKSCDRFSFASMALYSYPRGGQQVEGPSVNLAREVARCWGNIRYGADVVYDDETTRTIRGWAWDVQTNTRESQDATFAKLIYRKKGGWQKPDERDLRELTNKHAAIAVRNCLLHLVPPDLIDEAIREAKQTMSKQAAKDPDEARRNLIKAFGSLGVTVDDLEEYLGHAIKQITPDEIAELRGIWKSISDGNSVWSEYVPTKPPKKDEQTQAVEEALKGEQPKATEPSVTPPTLEELTEQAMSEFGMCDTLEEVGKVAHDLKGMTDRDDWPERVAAMADSRRDEIRATRGPRSKKTEN